MSDKQGAPAKAGVAPAGVLGIDMELGEIPEGSVLEIHPTFIIADMKEGWRTLIPMDNIRFINVAEPV